MLTLHQCQVGEEEECNDKMGDMIIKFATRAIIYVMMGEL